MFRDKETLRKSFLMGTHPQPRSERDLARLSSILAEANVTPRDEAPKLILKRPLSERLNEFIAETHHSGIFYNEAVREFKKQFIINVLKECRWNQCQAARALGMHRNTLSRAIEELKINLKEERRLRG
jgi:Fis family transcriptional regulator